MSKKVRVYISGPLTDTDYFVEEDNIKEATNIFYSLITEGFVPFCPHWSHLAERGSTYGMSYDDWINYDLEWLKASDAVYRMVGKSSGADIEVGCAMTHGIPVFYSLDEMVKHYEDRS